MSEYHLQKPTERYFVNTLKDGFKKIKGLTTIELCITELCTRKCRFCPRADSSIYANRRLFMSPETMSNIATKCFDEGYEGDFHVSGFGESLTHPTFKELMLILRNKLPNNCIVLTTNGDLLNDKVVEETIKKIFNKVIVSCYDGLEHKNKFIKLFESHAFFNYEIRELWYNENENTESLMERNNFNNRAGSVKVSGLNKNSASACFLPFYKLVFDWNGDALVCCNDWKRAHSGFGNINRSSLIDIWHGDEFTKTRSQLIKGNRIGPACKNCNIEGTIIGQQSVNEFYE
jgi:MoaA/NifB/PqqE/SkfB family radical SAM enzyme